MKYQLVVKTTGAIVTVTDSQIFGLNEAKAYYIRMKQLKEKEFDKLYTVEEYKQPEGMASVHPSQHAWRAREIKWWKDESTKLDDF